MQGLWNCFIFLMKRSNPITWEGQLVQNYIVQPILLLHCCCCCCDWKNTRCSVDGSGNGGDGHDNAGIRTRNNNRHQPSREGQRQRSQSRLVAIAAAAAVNNDRGSGWVNCNVRKEPSAHQGERPQSLERVKRTPQSSSPSCLSDTSSSSEPTSASNAATPSHDKSSFQRTKGEVDDGMVTSEECVQEELERKTLDNEWKEKSMMTNEIDVDDCCIVESQLSTSVISMSKRSDLHEGMVKPCDE